MWNLALSVAQRIERIILNIAGQVYRQLEEIRGKLVLRKLRRKNNQRIASLGEVVFKLRPKDFSTLTHDPIVWEQISKILEEQASFTDMQDRQGPGRSS